jgi:hypothetical protein
LGHERPGKIQAAVFDLFHKDLLQHSDNRL